MMNRSLRSRLLLTLAPLFVLLVALGSAGAVLLYRLGNQIEAILYENYDSVVYMERLNEAMERIDSSFQFALAHQEKKARDQYAQEWPIYERFLDKEEHNITLPGESDEVDRLARLTRQYRRLGNAFYRAPARSLQRQTDYFQSGGLYDVFKQIKDASRKIRDMNADHMQAASRYARTTARNSLIGFGAGLGLAALLAVYLTWSTVNTILRPIRSITESVLAIGGGNLDQVVSYGAPDELGRLADAFNTMARQLRYYRQTDYARLLRTQRTSQATIDSFPDAVVVVDEEYRVEMANPAAQHLFGVVGKRPDQAAGLPWQPPDGLDRPLHEAVMQQQPYLPESFDQALVLRRENEERFFLPRILPIRDPYGNTLGAAILLEDITRFRLLDQVKSDLVATASHELKTPLTSIRLVLHLLLEEAEPVGSLTPKQAELLVDARDNAERLLAVVNRLLDLARLEQGRERIDLQPMAPADLLRAAADAIHPRASDKAITVQVEAGVDLPNVAADATRLGHALGNLLDNALTYTERGGRIMLSATAHDHHVELTVTDTGQGIPPEYVKQIFTRFFRVPGHSRSAGTGLGLAITREIITAHRGTITCESQPGIGTTFRVNLPIWDADSLTEDGKRLPAAVSGA